MCLGGMIDVYSNLFQIEHKTYIDSPICCLCKHELLTFHRGLPIHWMNRMTSSMLVYGLEISALMEMSSLSIPPQCKNPTLISRPALGMTSMLSHKRSGNVLRLRTTCTSFNPLAKTLQARMLLPNPRQRNCWRRSHLVPWASWVFLFYPWLESFGLNFLQRSVSNWISNVQLAITYAADQLIK